MALLSIQVANPDTSLLNVAFTAVNSGDTIVIPDDRTFLLVKNGSGSPTTVTLATPGTIYGQPIPDPGFVVAAGNTAVIPLLPGRYMDPAALIATITYSAVTTITAAAVRI